MPDTNHKAIDDRLTHDAEQSDYAAFARQVYATNLLSDPYIDGTPRFALDAAMLGSRLANDLIIAAERVAYLHQELVEILLASPQLVTDYFHLTACQRAMWEAAGGMWHGMARADLFVLEDGTIQCCELNSDTPSGQAEAVVLNELLYERNARTHCAVRDPNADFAAGFVRLLRQSFAKRTDAPLTSVGILYPTELTEDLAMMTLFRRWLEAENIKVVTGSPYNIRRTKDGIEVLGNQVDVIYRHYKTDWWSERVPVWRDAPDYLDALPLYEPLAALLDADMRGDITIVNPFGAVITQNKFSLAFMWDEIARFTPHAQNWIRALIPETRRMSEISASKLSTERAEWVLKSDYGCEGAETVCGAFVTQEVWNKTIAQAKPEHFVAQRFFHVAHDSRNRLPNFGVYVLGGAGGGFFTRLSTRSTEYNAVTASTFICP
ncbi:MAG: glutathionylspermidine synthase family protein [Pyrinomonadaceae bacterium MAG19_C2-C3]|nr:glutathionylspermidine synthase family protein [Pyrinomonadaceae bacterium MAG19_C2-C3]